MKREYSSPEMTITSYTQEDIITASGIATNAVQTNFDKKITYGNINFN